MLADIPQGANGNGGSGGVDGYAAAISVSDRDNIVHSGITRQNLRADAPHGVIDGRGDALDSGRDPENVLGSDAAVGVSKAVEGVAGERRQRRGDGCR